MSRTNNIKPLLPEGIYAITAERFSAGRSNIQVVEEMIKGGVSTIQYREKKEHKSAGAMLAECQQIRALTKKNKVTFIVNDHVDLAMLVDADGVHVGQEDLPVEAVRRLVGPEKIIGLSTHSSQQIEKAVTAGADYIGIGPIFSTGTKKSGDTPLGIEFLTHVAQTCPLPFVPIGGIKRQHLRELVAHGAKTICLVTEIVSATNIAATVSKLRARLTD
ncbi:MAG: thiamine phosphate synthase [Chloroflexi bacterium]|nr:MAG: thiamine phosphate synthase [Chloroflexota bacterium]